MMSSRAHHSNSLQLFARAPREYMDAIPTAADIKKSYLEERFKEYKEFFIISETQKYNNDFEKEYSQLAQELFESIKINEDKNSKYYQRLQRLTEKLNFKIAEDDEDSDPLALPKKMIDLTKSGLVVPIYVNKFLNDKKYLFMYCDIYKTYIASIFEGYKGLWSMRHLYRLMNKLSKGTATQFKTKFLYHVMKIGQLGLALALMLGAVSLTVLMIVGIFASAFLLYKANYILLQTRRGIHEIEDKLKNLEGCDDSFSKTQFAYLENQLKKLKKNEYYQIRARYRAAGSLLASILGVVGFFIPPVGLIGFVLMCFITTNAIHDLKEKKIISKTEKEFAPKKEKLNHLNFFKPSATNIKELNEIPNFQRRVAA